MSLSIGQRLFVISLGSAMVVAALSIELVRWQAFDNFADSEPGDELEQLEPLRVSLAAQYALTHDWSFLPALEPARSAWLRAHLAGASTLGYRIGLLDAERHLRAGVTASAPLQMLASLDTRTLPIDADGARIGTLVVASAAHPADELAVAFLLQQQGRLGLIAALAGLLTALAAALLSAHVRKPIVQLVELARRLSRSQFDARVHLKRRDELGELGDTFNQLAARLERVEHERRQWVADTSHELRTPLAVLRAHIEALQDGVRTDSPESRALMLQHLASLTTLVDSLSVLANADVGPLKVDKVPVDVWQLLRDVVASFEPRLAAAGLTTRVGAAPDRAVVPCDPERFRQVVINLLENAVRYTNAGGQVALTGAVVGEALELHFDDSAPGVPEAALPRLGERFFRVDAARSRERGGSGLGLAVCRQWVEAHQGRLTFTASPLGGVRATVRLPFS